MNQLKMENGKWKMKFPVFKHVHCNFQLSIVNFQLNKI